LWRRSQVRSRFQARLSILFFLFALIPTVPLTGFVSLLVTKSTELLLLPGVEPALSRSIEAMRTLLHNRGELFLSEHPDMGEIQSGHLENAGAVYSGEIRASGAGEQIVVFRGLDSTAAALSLRSLDFRLVQSEGAFGRIVGEGEQQVYQVFRSLSDSTLHFVGLSLPADIVEAKNDLTLALKNVASLNLLRETFVEQGLMWAGAVVFILILALISVLLARAIARGISEPIRQLTEGMRRIGAGDLSHRIEVKASDEIEFLVHSFNQMAEELKESRENLKRAERAAAWRDVARQVSHEIKNPLTPIQLSLHRIKTSLPAEWIQRSDLEKSFRVIEEEINSMRRIATEFSEFAQMPHLDLKEDDVAEVLRRSAHLFEGEAYKISLKLEIDQDLPRVAIDRHQLRRAIHNLLKNAMEASRPGEEVTLRAKSGSGTGSGIRIEITDHGHGMDQPTLERAMDPYFTTKKRGSGLGLFIVQRIIGDHGGRIEISSEKNRGTTVSISL